VHRHIVGIVLTPFDAPAPQTVAQPAPESDGAPRRKLPVDIAKLSKRCTARSAARSRTSR
jgi:hypothetical protein